jgi:autotransporter-associated beta strand protein
MKTNHSFLGQAVAATLLGATLLSGPTARGADGTWTNLIGGSWAVAANWSNSVVASGTNSTADFSQRTLTGATTVTLDGARSIGGLTFGDQGNTYGWTLGAGSGGPLTLAVNSGSPTIAVSNQSAAISVALAGNQGLTKTGPGTLVLSGINTYTNATLISQGTVQVFTNNGSLGIGTSNSVTIDGGKIAALFSPAISIVTPFWPITVGANGGEIDLLQGGNNGRWLFAANTLSGSGTLTLKPGATRFGLTDQSVSGFSGKWVLDGGNRLPSVTSGLNYMPVLAGADVCFGATPATFTPDAVTLINNGVILTANTVGASMGSATRGFTIGSGGGQFFVSGPNNFTIAGPISGTTGDPVYFTANNNNAGAQLSLPSSYNGNSIIHNLTATSSKTWVRLGTNEALPSGAGKGLVAYSSAGAASVAVLDLNGFNQTINGFGANNGLSQVDDLVGGGSCTLNVGSADTSSTFAGSIRNTSGTVNVTKIGNGTLTLTGTNTYSGATTVSGGTLAVAPAGQAAGGSYTVADGATLGLTVTSNSPSLAMTNLTLGNTSGATLALIFGSNPSSAVAPVIASNLTVNAATLSLTFAGGVAVGQYPLIGYPAGSIGGGGFSALSLVTSPAAMSAVLTNNTASNSVDVVVLTAPTISVGLSSSANPGVRGQPVIFSATVTVSGLPASGTVTFMNGATTMGTATLNGAGIARLTNSFVSLGTFAITASYGGSTSLPVNQVISPALDSWTGAGSSAWDIVTSTNWATLGVPAKYYEGDQVQFDDTATGSTAVTLAGPVNPASVLCTNGSKSYSLSGAGSIAGATGLVKDGAGTLTLNNTNGYTGDTVIRNGALTFSGTASYTGSGVPGALYVGGGAGTSVLNMNSAGTLAFGRYASLGGITGNTNDTGSGAVNQSSGTINLNVNSGGAGFLAFPMELGAGGPGAYGYYKLSGGALNTLFLNTIDAQSIRVGAGGQGVFLQTGGTISDSGYLDIGYASGSAPGGGTGVATFTGGSAAIGSVVRLGVALNGSGVLNMGTEAGGTASLNASGVQLLPASTATNAVVNLNSGVLQIGGAISLITGSTGTSGLNLNGGTLRAGNNLTLINGINNAALFRGGVVFDTQGFTESESAALAPASGNGIYPAGGTLAIGSGGGSGYIGAPLVTVTNTGSGSGAMAIANLSGGVVTGVTLTCPGMNYQAGDSLSFFFAGGGAATAASTFNYTLQAADVAPNAPGGLTKLGTGKLVLTGFNSYTGTTVVSNGALQVDSTLSASPVTVVNGTLLSSGSGFISGPVTIQSGGTLAGGYQVGVYNSFSISGALTLSGTASLRIDKPGGSPTSDLITGMSQVTYGGTLVVSNATNTAALALNDKFTLFTSAGSYSNTFANFNLPALPAGLRWDTSGLGVDGSIQVVAGSTLPTAPTNLVFAVVGGGSQLHLSWPSNYTGWLVQSNGVSLANTNFWFTVPGSDLTNELFLPVDRSKTNVFYRMLYP